MTTEEKRTRLKRLEKDLADIRTKLNKRRAELRKKDLERRKREFDRLPLEQRKVREAIGWSPYQADAPIRRIGGGLEIK